MYLPSPNLPPLLCRCFTLIFVGRENEPFFKKKPTFRKLTSQHPYAEKFIGKPYVYTINPKNHTAVEAMMEEIKHKRVCVLFTFYDLVNNGTLGLVILPATTLISVPLD